MNRQNQLNYLRAMGIPIWVSRDGPIESVSANQDETKQTDSVHSANAIIESLDRTTGLKHKAGKETKQVVSDPVLPVSANTTAVESGSIDCGNLDWDELQQAVSSCHSCGLSKSRTSTVFGAGDRQAEWLIIGEAPGSEEDRQGQPFVGRAGQLLTNMLAALGLSRDAVFIANLLKCRPPNNRDPLSEEVSACKPYLDRQIALLKPKLILVVGRIAAQNLLHSSEPLARLRGAVHSHPEYEIPVIVTYHPAYLLRKPIDKRKAWDDLKLAHRVFHAN